MIRARVAVAWLGLLVLTGAECDRQLLAVSATKLVNQYRNRIVEFLSQP